MILFVARFGGFDVGCGHSGSRRRTSRSLSLSTVFSFRSLLQVFYEVAEDECVSEGSRGVFGDPWRRGRELPGVA